MNKYLKTVLDLPGTSPLQLLNSGPDTVPLHRPNRWVMLSRLLPDSLCAQELHRNTGMEAYLHVHAFIPRLLQILAANHDAPGTDA